MKLTCKELGEANSYITDIAQKTVKGRLAEILIHLDDEFGVDHEKKSKHFTHPGGAFQHCGYRHRIHYQVTLEFKTIGLIELNGRKIKILDKPGLKYIAACR